MSVKIKSFTLLIFTLGLVFTSCKEENEEKSILVYCAAGIKPVVEKVAKAYYEEYGVRVDLQYGGSGTLLTT